MLPDGGQLSVSQRCAFVENRVRDDCHAEVVEDGRSLKYEEIIVRQAKMKAERGRVPCHPSAVALNRWIAPFNHRRELQHGFRGGHSTAFFVWSSAF